MNFFSGKEYFIFDDFIFPLVFSIISGWIFWGIVEWWPSFNRKRGIKAILDMEYHSLYLHVFFIFDIITHITENKKGKQSVIYSNLDKDTLQFYLSNKCINNTFKYDNRSADMLIPVGNKLKEQFINTVDSIDRILQYNSFLKVKEIILLEGLKSKVNQSYIDPDKGAAETAGNQMLLPLNPTLSGYYRQFLDIHQYFVKLQVNVFSSKIHIKNNPIAAMVYFYYTNQDNKCENLAKIIIANKLENSEIASWFLLSIHVRKGGNNVFQKLERIIKNKPSLIDNRSFLKNFISDIRIDSLLAKYYSKEEIARFYTVIYHEQQDFENFKKQSEYLRGLYK